MRPCISRAPLGVEQPSERSHLLVEAEPGAQVTGPAEAQQVRDEPGERQFAAHQQDDGENDAGQDNLHRALGQVPGPVGPSALPRLVGTPAWSMSEHTDLTRVNRDRSA